MPMLERIAGNRELKQDLKTALGSGRIAHSILLVGEPGCGAGFAARCLAADYLYPNGGPHAEAVLRGQDTESIVVRGEGASGQIKVEAIRDARQNIQKSALSSDAEGRVLFIYGAQNLNGASANAMLKIMEEPPEGVMFLLTASSAAAVLPTIRSRCVSFAVAPVSPEQCARYCAAQGVDKKTAALYSELFDGHIGTVLAAAQDEARTAQVEKALQLAKAAADRDSYAAACLLAAYEKDKAGAAALLTDFRAVAAAGLRQSPHAPVQGIAAKRALRLAEAAIQRLGAQVNPKIVLSVFAAKFRAL